MQKKMKVKIQGEIEVICTPVEDAPKLQHTGQNVIFAVPGKEADVLPLSMADELFATFSQQICTEELDDTGLYLEYDSRLVIPFDHEQFIIGPVLVYAMDKKRIVSLTPKQIEQAKQALKVRMVVLSDGQCDCSAYRL